MKLEGRHLVKQVDEKVWEKYLIKETEIPEDKQNKKRFVYMTNEHKTEIVEPTICKTFGCGRTLSSKETLYSEHCYKHQKYFGNPE